jgi:hypothetical protein
MTEESPARNARLSLFIPVLQGFFSIFKKAKYLNHKARQGIFHYIQ